MDSFLIYACFTLSRNKSLKNTKIAEKKDICIRIQKSGHLVLARVPVIGR